jgi:hypothetical protein
MEIHSNINDILDGFISNNNVPNIIFHGPSGSGKSRLLGDFIRKIYKNGEKNRNNILFKNCAKTNGIKSIRDDIKMFIKSNVSENENGFSKTVVLDHADELTDDAQSVLRRCIEIYTSTRFFILIEDYSRLIDPIISRFCSLYVGLPTIEGKRWNLHEYNIRMANKFITPHYSRVKVLTNLINKCGNDDISILDLSHQLYNMSYDSRDIVTYIMDRYGDNHEVYKEIINMKMATNTIPNERYIMWYILNYSITFLKTI